MKIDSSTQQNFINEFIQTPVLHTEGYDGEECFTIFKWNVDNAKYRSFCFPN